MLGYLHPNDVSAVFHKSQFDLFGFDLTHDARIAQWVDVRAAIMGIPDARNKICEKFLESDCEWLFSVDSDMGFEPIMLDQLLAVADKDERPVVGALAFAFREAIPDGKNGFRCFPTPTIMDWWQHNDGIFRYTSRTHYPINSLVKCDSTGCAAIVIHRSVIGRMKAEHGEHWFDRVQDPKGDWMGEDISFCERCKHLGIPIYVHTGIRTTHFKHLWLGEDDFWDSFLPPPAQERVDVIVPVLHRPQNVRTLMVSLTASTGLATAWYICEPGDEEQMAEVRKYGGQVLEHPGTFAQKVNWAYREIRESKAPWILLVGDDVRFRPSWLDHALDVSRRYQPAVIGTNDLVNPRVIRGEHATHMMILKAYIDEHGASWDGPGIVCHEGYHHWYVDDEIVSVAKQRRSFQSAHGSQVEHMHPLGNSAPLDEIYELGMAHTEEDKKLFEARLLTHTVKPNGVRPNRATRRKPKLALVGAKETR